MNKKRNHIPHNPVNLLHTCRAPFNENIFERLLPTWLNLHFESDVCSRFII